MFATKSNPIDAWITKSTEAFEFWASLWPTAPLYGVKWRFADTFEKMAPGFRIDLGYTAIERAARAEPFAAEAKETVIDATAVEVTVSDATMESATPAAPAQDDLTKIKGIGPGLERQLNELGVTSLAQLAGLSDVGLARIDSQLTSFKGRCFRDDWVGQAKALIG